MEVENIIKFINKSNTRLKEGLDSFLDVYNKKNEDLYSKIEDKLTEEEKTLYKENNEEHIMNLNMFIEEYEEFNLDNIKSFHNAQFIVIHKRFSKAFNDTQIECMDKVNELDLSKFKQDNESLENSDNESDSSNSMTEEDYSNLLQSYDMTHILQENNDSDTEEHLNRDNFMFNIFNSSIEDVSETDLSCNHYDEDTLNEGIERLDLELLNFKDVKALAKSKMIILSKDGRKKNKSDLINDILES
jgi:hypothetical protein